MARKFPWIFIIAGSLLLLGLLWMQTPRVVSAQCSNPSSCKSCHEIQGQKPVNTIGDWHTEHAYIDACVACHGGDRQARTLAEAHVGVANQLEQMSAGCQSCHSDDLKPVFTQYAEILGIKDIDAALAGAAAGSWSSRLGSTLGIGAAEVPVPAEGIPAEPANRTGNLILAVMLIAGLGGGSTYVVWNERRLLKGVAGQPWWSWILARLCQQFWSPYAAGVLLGLVCIATVVLTQHLTSASGGVASLASTLLHAIAPQMAEEQMYFKFIIPPGFNWQILMLVGLFVGGLLASLSSRTFRLRWNDDPTWIKVFGPSRLKRFIFGFLAAVLIQIGAGIAGGCTSGLAISGGMLLAPSAFLFMIGMFISGIIVALLVYRRRY